MTSFFSCLIWSLAFASEGLELLLLEPQLLLELEDLILHRLHIVDGVALLGVLGEDVHRRAHGGYDLLSRRLLASLLAVRLDATWALVGSRLFPSLCASWT